MPTFSRILSSAEEKLLFRPVTITGLEVVGQSFRLLTMQGILAGNLTKRAYTPQSPQWVFTGQGTLHSKRSERPEAGWHFARGEQGESLSVFGENWIGLGPEFQGVRMPPQASESGSGLHVSDTIHPSQ